MQIEPSLEARIVELRRRRPRWGARGIHAELRGAGIEPPAVATIHRALCRGEPDGRGSAQSPESLRSGRGGHRRMRSTRRIAVPAADVTSTRAKTGPCGFRLA
jgi:hypothetical protein